MSELAGKTMLITGAAKGIGRAAAAAAAREGAACQLADRVALIGSSIGLANRAASRPP